MIDKKVSDCTQQDCCKASAASKPLSKAEHSKPPPISDPEFQRSSSHVDSILTPKEKGQSDLENGPIFSEHVALSIQGMTCTGCETKLHKSLQGLKSIGNLQISLLLSRVEFDIDLNVGSVTDVMDHLKRTTEFDCKRITTKGQKLDVVRSEAPSDLLDQPLPNGVTEISLLDKQAIRVDYDSEVIGARVLLDRGFSRPLQLAPLRPHPSTTVDAHHMRKTGLMTLLSMVLTIPVLILAWAPLPDHPILYGALSLAFATVIQVVVAGPFYPSAIKALVFTKVMEVDLLIVLSTSAAYVFSVVSFGFLVNNKPLATGEFFDTSALLVTLIMTGRFISATARQRAVASISIRSLQSPAALLIDDSDEREIDARLLQYGDILKIAPDSRITTDGTVISGSSEVDESMMTGEAKLIEKSRGSTVIAGSVNHSGILQVRVTRLPGDNSVSAIAEMVDEAKLSKPKSQDLADVVAGYFIPVVLGLTVITFAVWMAVGITIRKNSASEAAIQAITYGIAVLIVSCPCALGLAVPMVIVIAGGVAADHGIIFKSGSAIENARKVSHVVFDKTGTLTEGRLRVAAEHYLKEQASTQSLLLGLISNIKHPVSSAVADHLISQNVTPARVQGIKTLTGKGVEGSLAGAHFRAGNSRWLGVESWPRVQSLLSRGLTVFCVAVNNDLHAIFGLEDSIQPDALKTVNSLTARGIAVSIVSGDDDGAVQSIATLLGIPSSHTKSRCLPAEKQKYLQTLMATPNSTILFCGDGTNDAIALAQAYIGVHMNSGTDVARSAADVLLVRPALGNILLLMDLSRATFRRIVFNFAWAFVYNIFAITLAAGAFVRARVPPQYAGLGEIVSVLPVILIALQLKWAKFA
ncbi:hypothetical protein MMC07_004436 [Pseudocyphellaria aurata]|nr:hypothetical protein [Pseudocyphellaria aurata]